MHLLAGNAFKPAWRWGSRRGSPPLPVAHVVARGGEQRPPRRPVAAREAQVARGLARAAPAPARPLEPAEPGQVERQPPGGDAVHPAEEVLEPGVQGVHAGERGVRLVARVVGEVLGVDAQRLLDAGVGPVCVVSVNLFFTSFAKQARRSRKGGFTGCANVFSPIPVTA